MTGQPTNARRRWSIVLASREVWPFVEGGGLGRYMWAAAGVLSRHADVAILTSSRWRSRYQELAEAGDGSVLPGVRYAFVDEPKEDVSPFLSWNHLWSLRLVEGAAELHPGGGPDILEVADYQAEGFAAAHAKRGRDPRLANTTLAVRLHTSMEMCAALNESGGGLHLDVLAGLERFPLRFADALLEPGGDCLERYVEFYGPGALAPALRSPLPATPEAPAQSEARPPPAEGPLRLLYLNRLERRKGIVELISAIRSLPDADLTLTVVGRDTTTGPDGSSMRAHAVDLAAGDPRVRFLDQVPHEDVPQLIGEHHAVVVPTRWETFSYVAREALAYNRPVVATPAGAIVDVVRPGESGWLAESASADALAATLAEVIAERDALARMIADGRPRAVFTKDESGESSVEAYLELLERRGEARAARNGEPAAPRVTALVACRSGGADPLGTLRSLESQRGAAVAPVLVVEPSGGLPGSAPALARAAAVVATARDPATRSAPWAAGLLHASDELVLLVPAGALLEPDFVRRAATALHREADLAWVTSFVRAAETPAQAPPGSYHLPLDELGASPSIALVRRSALEAMTENPNGAPDGNPDLFVRLAQVGAHGLVLQEPLIAGLPRTAAYDAHAQR